MIEKYILEKSKDGYDILKINNESKSIYIGSKYNEEREVKKVIELAKPITEKDNYIILGLGMGNYIKELKKNNISNSQILIIECEEDWIDKFENEFKKDDDFRNSVHIVKNKNDIRIFFEKYITEQNISSLKSYHIQIIIKYIKKN